MHKIGIVSCDKWKNVIKEDLFLKEALISKDIDAQIVSWEDKSEDFKDYDFLILRSVWGYQEKVEKFKNWLRYLDENNIKIFNSTNIISSNIDKEKQFEILDKYNIEHIPTYFVDNIETLMSHLNDEYKVIKPTISGSGQDTYIVGGNDKNSIKLSEIELVASNIFKHKKIMVQPFIKQINEGEYAVVMFDGQVSHVMKRYPGIFGKHQKPQEQNDVPQRVIDFAKQIIDIEEYKNVLYSRVDLVDVGNKLMVMEVELAEPDLLIKYIKDEKAKNKALALFTDSIKRRL